jgi:hypothetical protein
MSRARIRSEHDAHAGMVHARNAQREALATSPSLQSVRLLLVAKRRRDAARERIARLACCGLLPSLAVAAFYFITR